MGLTGVQAAYEVLPLGNTDPQRVREAAEAVYELVRHLNHSTFHRDALPYPSTVGEVAGQVHAAVWGIGQLLGQLATRLDHLAGEPRLYHDRHRGDRAEAADAARQAAEHLRQACRARPALTDPLQEALKLVGHLGVLTPGETR